jgi:hypothetical protein
VTKSVKLVLAIVAVTGLLTSAQATSTTTKSLLTNHGVVAACTDQNVPGAPLFTTFGSSMDNPSIMEDGTVMFGANMAGPTITAANSRAIFEGTSLSDLQILVQWSDPAPGLPGLYLVSNSGTQGIGPKRIAPDGRLLFASRLSNDAHNLPRAWTRQSSVACRGASR